MEVCSILQAGTVCCKGILQLAINGVKIHALGDCRLQRLWPSCRHMKGSDSMVTGDNACILPHILADHVQAVYE